MTAAPLGVPILWAAKNGYGKKFFWTPACETVSQLFVEKTRLPHLTYNELFLILRGSTPMKNSD
jgi:hypothetical protein